MAEGASYGSPIGMSMVGAYAGAAQYLKAKLDEIAEMAAEALGIYGSGMQMSSAYAGGGGSTQYTGSSGIEKIAGSGGTTPYVAKK